MKIRDKSGQIWSKTWTQLWYQSKDHIIDSVRNSIWDKLPESIGGNCKIQIRAHLRSIKHEDR